MVDACSADQEFIFRGDLSETPLPQMMATVHRHGVPGVMMCSQKDEAKRIFFVDGDVIFATSTDRVESLGDYLLKQGRITKAQYRVSSDELHRSPGKRHGTVLVEMGFLKQEQLGAAVREQVQGILWSLFNWQDGEVTFSVGRFRDGEVYKIRIPTPRAILSGCKRIQDGRRATAAFGGRDAILRVAERPEHLRSLRLEVQEQRLLEMIDGKRTVVELCEKGPLRPGLNARVLYAFIELQLIERESSSSKGAIRVHVGNKDSI
ncbi:MAG: DUF4388 domain-containing protein [bacterium]|nr:DUF4388 domain-containing protein [bacterium]